MSDQDRGTRRDGPTNDRQVDALARVHENPFAASVHQTGPMTEPTNDATEDGEPGEGTGNARRAAAAATGSPERPSTERTADDAERAYGESRGRSPASDATAADRDTDRDR